MGMYFGVRGNMRMVKTPRIDMDVSKTGWGTSSQYLNGGAGVRTSTGAHKEYGMTWAGSRDDVRAITDYADGLYDTDEGVNLIYFLDPAAMDKNVLPQLWASPFQQSVDGLTLFPGQKASIDLTPSNGLGYPARSVSYLANRVPRSLWVPIPAGFTAWVGVHGVADAGAGLTVATTDGANSATPTLLDTLAVTDPTRFSASFAAGSNVDGILLAPANLGPGATERFTWAGTMVQILRNGITPAPGDFISGQGHSGCQFYPKPTLSTVMAHGSGTRDGWVNLSAKLIETGSWI